MKSAKNELKQFVAGVVMLIVGLFILSQKVVVSSGWFGYGGTIMLGGVRLNSGDDYDSVYYRYYMDVRKRSLFCIEVVYGIECHFDCSIHYFKYKYLHGFNINV